MLVWGPKTLGAVSGCNPAGDAKRWEENTKDDHLVCGKPNSKPLLGMVCETGNTTFETAGLDFSIVSICFNMSSLLVALDRPGPAG